MNGVKGASSLAVSPRQKRSVSSAAEFPSQKRRRLRRTYQLESSSVKSAIARAAEVQSKASIRSRTSAIVRCSRETAQRSSSVTSGPDCPVAHFGT